jgi:hypothetical protein
VLAALQRVPVAHSVEIARLPAMLPFSQGVHGERV